MDHKDALKGFHSESSLTSIKCRMSLIDTLNEMRQSLKLQETTVTDNNMGWRTTTTDMNHILQLTGLILRRGGLLLKANDHPINVYTKDVKLLPPCILDVHYKEIGEFLITKYLVKEQLCGLTTSDYPDILDVVGPQELMKRPSKAQG